MTHRSSFPPAGGLSLRLAVAVAAAPAGEIPRNAHAWLSISDFLWNQWLDSFGLRRTVETDPRRGPARGEGPQAVRLGARQRSIPHGNHGDNNLLTSGAGVGGLSS